MSFSASLSLLKGGKKEAVEAELETNKNAEAEAQATVEAAEEEVVVDVDAMSSKELDALVDEHGIEVPDNWSKMKVGEKRQWLKDQFEEAEDEATEQVTEQVEAKAEEPTQEAQEAEAEASGAAQSKEEQKAAPKKGKASKSKAVAEAPKSGTIETPGEDLLSDLVHEIENMKEQEARKAALELNNETELTLFKLGGVLSVIQANQWFEPYATFREYVEKEVGLNYRKATYWTAIYNHLAESKIPWDKVKHIGWTKLKEIAEVLTVDNVDEWVKVAQSQTTIQLIETVKAHKQKGSSKAIDDQASKVVTTITFKVHEDQKETIKSAIAKAKENTGTTVDTAALEFICLDYLGSMSVAERLKAMGIEAAVEALEKAFPEATITVEI